MPPTATEEARSIEQNGGEHALATIDTTGVGFFSAGSFDLIQRVGKLFAASSLVPQQYQNNLANCVIALNMAQRIGADPLMVMQNLYVVHGRPGWSAQFLIATFNQNGRFTALRYEFSGEPGTPQRGCRAWAVEKATSERLTGSLITLQLANDEGWVARSGSKWKTMPDQMLMYRSAAWFIRAYAPEIAMGLHTVEELNDIVETVKDERGIYGVPTTVAPDNLGSIIDGAQVSAQDNAPPGSNAPTKEEAAAPPAETPPAETKAPEPPPAATGARKNRASF